MDRAFATGGQPTSATTVQFLPGNRINSPFGFQRFAKVPRRATIPLFPFTRKSVRLLQRRQ